MDSFGGIYCIFIVYFYLIFTFLCYVFGVTSVLTDLLEPRASPMSLSDCSLAETSKSKGPIHSNLRRNARGFGLR